MKSSDQSPNSALAIRIKVTGVKTRVLPVEQPLSPSDIKLVRKTLKAMNAKAIISKPTGVCVSVTVMEISEAAFRRLAKRKITFPNKEEDVESVAQNLTLVVDGKCVFKTPEPLSFERNNLLAVVENRSRFRLADLLQNHHNFTIYNQIVNGKGRSYAKLKSMTKPDAEIQEEAALNRDKAETAHRISQPARQRQIAFAAVRR